MKLGLSRNHHNLHRNGIVPNASVLGTIQWKTLYKKCNCNQVIPLAIQFALASPQLIPLLEKYVIHLPSHVSALQPFVGTIQWKTFSINSFLALRRARFACSRCYSLYICTRAFGPGMGKVTSDNWDLRNLSYNQKNVSRDIDINKIGICISNYPSWTVEATFLGQFWNMFTF